mmetsp:Transcript_16798/g.36117  ORF Transcript_16798/g.36117 Transcript_16798/m.36117 type:complete len:225 (-) Transcript_16798:148-822(-)
MVEEASLNCWERARIDENANFEGIRTVFGYGSLIFRPGFPYRRAFPVRAHGFYRRFWQLSADHRGTPESPGRVTTLLKPEDVAGANIQEPPTVCGVAYEVDEEHWEEVLVMLDIRERHGYVRTVVDIEPVLGQANNDSSNPNEESFPSRSLVYYAHEPLKSSAFAGPEPLEKTAAVIAKSVGPSGANVEYLLNLVGALETWGLPEDLYLTSLVQEVKRIRANEE